ncbi:MAG: hypothetical protein H8E37_13835 [Planctomycetes bacterium]|nr:hypothetical protein [Planctomycetota bacterium]
MERICLVSGLDDPAKRPQVDVLVPDGELVEIAGKGIAFEATLDMEILGGTNLGAARLETLPTGGGNFHLAGHALKPGGPQITVGEAVVARSFPIDGVSGSELDEVAEGEATAVESDESVESVAQPAEDFVVEIDGGTTFDGGEIEPLQLKSSWLTINWGRDPFSMDNGEKTYVSLDWWVGAAGGMAVAKRSRLHGNITISKPHVEASLVNATLTGSFDQSNYSDGNATSSTAAATFDFSLKRSTNAGQESLSLGVFVGQQLIVFEATWSNSPRQVQLKMDLQGKGGAGKYLKLLLSGILAESTDVLSAGNSYHNAAVTGLEMIGGAIQDPAFALTRQSLLFPPAAKTVTELRATRDWVLFHRRRQRTCDKVETPEVEQLTHIVATSWQHSGTESEFLPIEQPGVNDPLGIGIVIGFDSPVKLIDPTDSSIFQVSADINMAKLQQLGGQFTLVELLQVVPLIRSLQSCRCLHGNIVPVNWEAVPDQPGRISRAIATSAPARGLAFMFDPQDIGLAQTRQAGARYDIKLRCDFILDQKNNPIDGEFLRAQFPTGNSHPGGIFESWFDVSPIAGKDRQEVYLTKGIHSEDAVSALQGSIEKAGFSFNANTMDRLGEVTFDESNADVSGLDGVESAYKSAFPNLPTGVGITTLSVLRKGLDANTHSRFHSQAERIRDRIATGDPVIQVVSGENAGIREGDSALSILIAVRGIE